MNRGRFQSGQKPWNAGLKNWRKDYKHGPSTLAKLRKPQSVRVVYKSTDEERLRKSWAYKKWKKSIFARDKICKICNSQNKLHAHHIIPIKTDFTKALDESNGLLLCSTCHAKVHDFGSCRKKFTGKKAEKALN